LLASGCSVAKESEEGRNAQEGEKSRLFKILQCSGTSKMIPFRVLRDHKQTGETKGGVGSGTD